MIIKSIPIEKLNPAVYNPRKDLKPGDPDYEKLGRKWSELKREAQMATSNNNISTKREQTCQRIIQALRETKGLLTLAAHKAGVSYPTINRYAHDFPSVREAVLEAKESVLDFAESKLYENIKGGDNACIIFYLKTQGKARGYLERQEIEHSGYISNDPEELTDAQLASIIMRRRSQGIAEEKNSKEKADSLQPIHATDL